MTKIEALELELKARKMVEGTELDWWSVIKFRGFITAILEHPPLFTHGVANYELALGIIEGRPAWEGDQPYFRGNKVMLYSTSPYDFKDMGWSWNPPTQKTATIRDRLTTNAEDFDAIVSELLAENEELRKASQKKEIDVLKVSKRKAKETSDTLFMANQQIASKQEKIDELQARIDSLHAELGIDL